MISAFTACKLVNKGCEAYSAYVLDSRIEELKLENIPTVKEYLNVFPEVLLGLPLD